MVEPGALGGAASPGGLPVGEWSLGSRGGLGIGEGAEGGAGSGSPPIETGVAAPRLVAGAIAATWLA